MFFSKVLAVAACALATVVSAQQTLAFGQTPTNAQVGVATTITWGGGDGSPVTLTLREGDPNNLDTIAIIASSVSGNSFTWTPSSDLPPANDYALQITQGSNTINYSGLFSISGGSAPVSTTVVAIASSTTIPITTIAPNTTSLTTTASVTAVLTGTGSVGTGTSIARNTTFVSQTLSATGTAGVTAGSSTPTSGAGSTTASSSTAPVASTAGGAAIKAEVGLGLGAFAAALLML